jgi:hypothetical protein
MRFLDLGPAAADTLELMSHKRCKQACSQADNAKEPFIQMFQLC